MCENSQFRAGLLFHFKCHMKQLMTHRVIFTWHASLCVYISSLCVKLTLRVLWCDDWGVWNVIYCNDRPLTLFHVALLHIIVFPCLCHNKVKKF